MDELIEPHLPQPESPPRRRFRKRWIGWAFVAWWGLVASWNVIKPMPPGTDVSTSLVGARAEDVEFLYDLSTTAANGKPVYEQQIFDEVFGIIDNAQSFIVADFFLLNDMMGSGVHRPLSRELADHLLARKKASPDLPILVISDPINDVYGGMPSKLFDELRSAGIDVISTDLNALRDSNPSYSALWRMFLQWWGNSPDGGSMMNPFVSDESAEAQDITLRSWLALMNFKANHRKVIVADRSDGSLTALVTSANPHDASSAHSNVAIRFNGPLAQQIVDSEMTVARFSGWKGHIYASSPGKTDAPAAGAPIKLGFVTEGAIREHLLDAIDTTRNGDAVNIATFYISDRKIVSSLLRAADRGVKVRLILDPNRDAFGRQKDGVPNRPVARELVDDSGEKIQVRWYRTHGEQFHTKLALIIHGQQLIASLGSANLTRRNIGNYNLEANVVVETGADSELALEMVGYFDRLWNNDGPPGTQFTTAFGAWRDDDNARYWRYRLMEATGLSTF